MNISTEGWIARIALRMKSIEDIIKEQEQKLLETVDEVERDAIRRLICMMSE